MCGIVGLIRSDSLVEAITLTQMRDRLAHRGPDDAGLWISGNQQVGLAHRRLSIIDLSPAGHQPMSNEDGTVWIVYNGEVYNYTDLKHRLEGLGHRFRSNSDTETIIHAYEQWGVKCFSELRGMFALALWDERQQQLLLARDHTGIKPLLYYWDGKTFAFASEIKAFWALEGLDRSLDRSAIFDYLTYLYVPAPKTAYQYIRKLQPGHYLTFDGKDLTLAQYWDVPLEQDNSLDETHAVRLVQEQLADAVGMNMVSDVPVGVFLSGGLDSSTVVAHMTKLTQEPIRTFSIGFDVPEHSETAYARVVAEAFHTDHYERIVGRESVQELLSKMVSLYDEPYCDGSAMPTFQVSEMARKQVKVVLSGDGGDEVFAGYRWYDRWLRQQAVSHHIPQWLQRNVLALVGRVWPASMRGARAKHFLEGLAYDPLAQYARQLELFTPVEKRQLLGEEWAAEFADYDDYWYFRQYWHTELDPITRLQYLDLKTYLPDDILTKVDRASMAVGLEARPPLLDHLLIEAVFRVPWAIRFRNAEKKHLLKQAMNGILPVQILTRGKKGFSSPLIEWMAAERSWVDDFLRRSPRLIHPAVLESISRYAWGPKYWALLVLEEWARQEQV